MLPDIASAVRLQEVDNRLTDLTKEIASLPKHIDEIEKKLESHQRKLEADRAALGANQKDRKKLEGDIQVQEQKISKLKDQMLQAKTNDQYQAFQHEIGFCQAEIRRAEDRILDLMAESEGLEKNLKAAEVSLKAEKAQVEAEKQQARERTEVDQNAVNELEKAKKITLSHHLGALTTMRGQASDIGSNWLLTRDLNFSRHYLDAVQKVTLDDIKRVAVNYLLLQSPGEL